MGMTWGLFKRFVAEMEPLGAEALLDASIAANAVHWDQARWDALAAQARGPEATGAAGEARAADQTSAFRFNGAAMNPDMIEAQLGQLPGNWLQA